jgi:hypothetical protein
MAEYRIPDFTLEQRINAALEMSVPLPEREWGRVTELAEQHGVSRTILYEIRDRARQALVEVLGPRDAGRPTQSATLTVDKDLIDRAIAVWPMLTGTVRGIQQGLKLILNVRRSVGYISQTLTAAGEQSTAYNVQVTIPLPILGEADEIFQGRQPCLTVVDGRSFLAVNLTPAKSRDGTTWGVTFLDLKARGIQFQDLASDGGTGLLAGVREAKLAIPLRPDLFHILQDAHRLTQRLERAAYRAIETAERARQAEREAQGLERRRGPRLKITVPLPQAEIEEAQAIATFDLWVWLLGEIRQALEPITPDGRLVAVTETKATLETAVELLKELNHPEITTFANDLQQKIPALIAPLEWLEQQLASARQGLDAATETFILWTWQHRQDLELNIATDFPETLQPVVHAFWDTLSLFHRSSSLAESLHSWLRPHLQIHRGMPKWLLPLLQLFWNHHPFERGKRAGHSPLELAGVADAPSLTEVLDRLFRPSLSAQPV